jgi:hypothetical protein
MRLRAGRHQERNLYVQRGAEPSGEDEYIGVTFGPIWAAVLIGIANGDRPSLEDAGPDREIPRNPPSTVT